MKNSLTQHVLAHAAALPEGASVSAKELLHLGNRAAIDQTLSRLAKRGKLMKSGRGLYVVPVETRFGIRAPSAEAVVEHIAKLRGEIVVPHGAAAANRLGLTTQVPMRITYLTSGRSRRLKLGRQNIELQHAPRWQLTHAGRPSGEVVRALAWAGESQAPEAFSRIKAKLTPETRQELVSSRPALPQWLAQLISTELAA